MGNETRNIFWGDYVFFTQIFCVSTRIQFLEPCGKHRQLGAQLKLYLICAAGIDKRFAFNVRVSFARWEWLLFDSLFIKYIFHEIFGTDKRFAFNVRVSFARWEWLLFDSLFIKYIFWGDYQLFDTNILCFDASNFSNLMVRIGS